MGRRYNGAHMSPLRIVLLVVLVCPVSLLAQAKYTAEAEIGRQQFTNSCVLCHGPDGNAISGIDLGHGQYRRATSDADLVRIMRSGIPGTGMPPNNLTLENAKAKYLGIELSETEIALMKRVKQAFDPHGILNPGKIFP